MLNQTAPDVDVVLFRTHDFLAREKEAPDSLFQILEGWASKYRLLPDGRRQITALFLPGDFCEPQWALGRGPAQPITALTTVRAREYARHTFMSDMGDLQSVFWKNFVDSCERQANWLVTLGRRTALERLAHLLYELFERMRNAGLAYGQQCALPLTQMDIADLTGLTPVHVNRTLQTMRSRGLIELQSKWLRIPDISALQEAACMGGRDGAI